MGSLFIRSPLKKRYLFFRRRHHVFDIALSRSKHLTVGGGLPAMQSTRYVRKIASSFIAGKP
ncbi:hypothetical protein V2I80_10580, partial [Pseudomonas viridiflava]|uniref:hypothetical protein n=1 Tax=Pseudomonas viridiflava TaxID=33069 RepID=UPI002EA9C85E|nr:hypothetical protein [Pseudomonas viridiflava]